MVFPSVSPKAVLAAGAALVLGGSGVGYWLHVHPTVQLVSSAQECLSTPDHVASLFSDDQNTLIRYSNLDYSDVKVLRTEPSSTLPGMFDALLALSADSSRLAYVTAGNALMDDAHLWWIDVKQPAARHDLADVQQGLAPVRPAWSPDAHQLAYVIGRAPGDGHPAGFEIWVAHSDGSLPAQKLSDLPADVFARGHAASLCWTANNKVGILQGIESATGQHAQGVAPASSARQASPGPAAGGSGSSCGVPVFSQNDPAWRQQIMRVGGDPIGGFGCALTSTAMLLNYFGAALSPAELNACMGASADPLYWASAPGCTNGRVSGGVRGDFSWQNLDGFLGAHKPVIVGMVGGLAGMHFVVVTTGGGGVAGGYHITDPWDGTTTKTLAAYTNVGYNPTWIVTYDGASRNCARLLPSGPPPVQGFVDGGISNKPVTVKVPASSQGGDTTVQPVPNGGGASPSSPGSPTTATPTPSEAPSGSSPPSTSPTDQPSSPTNGSQPNSPPPTPSASPSSSRNPIPGARCRKVQHIPVGGSLKLTDDCIYLIYYCRHDKARPQCSIFKVTIERSGHTRISLIPLNPVSGATAAAAGRARSAAPAAITLGMPGQLRLNASDTLSGVQSIEYQLDGSPWTPYFDDVNFKGAAQRTLSVPVVGDHLISIRATNVAGTQATQPDQPFTVLDVQAPVTPSPGTTPTPTPRPTTVSQPAATSAPGPGPTTVPATPPAPPPPPPPTLSATASPTGLDIFTCPQTITFTAIVTYTGAIPKSFQYTWVSQAQEQLQNQPLPPPQQLNNFVAPGSGTVTFAGPGAQTVSATVSLGDSSGAIPAQVFTGGAQLKILSPSVLSNQAGFTLTCEQQ